MILPGGVYKKYIHLAVGIILILALLGPFVGKRIELEANFPSSESAYAMSNAMEDSERAEITRIYKKNLCEKMEKDIAECAGVEFDIRCDVSDAQERFGEIEKVYIMVDAEKGIKINERALELLCKNYGIENGDICVKYIT